VTQPSDYLGVPLGSTFRSTFSTVGRVTPPPGALQVATPDFNAYRYAPQPTQAIEGLYPVASPPVAVGPQSGRVQAAPSQGALYQQLMTVGSRSMVPDPDALSMAESEAYHSLLSELDPDTAAIIREQVAAATQSSLGDLRATIRDVLDYYGVAPPSATAASTLTPGKVGDVQDQLAGTAAGGAGGRRTFRGGFGGGRGGGGGGGGAPSASSVEVARALGDTTVEGPESLAGMLDQLSRVAPGQILELPPLIRRIMARMGRSPLFARLLELLGFTPIGDIAEDGFPQDYIVPDTFNVEQALALLSTIGDADRLALEMVLEESIGVNLPDAGTGDQEGEANIPAEESPPPEEAAPPEGTA